MVVTSGCPNFGDGVIEVLATAGNNHLGGDDFDQKVTDYMISEFKRTEGVDLSNDKADVEADLNTLKEAVNRAPIDHSRFMMKIT